MELVVHLLPQRLQELQFTLVSKDSLDREERVAVLEQQVSLFLLSYYQHVRIQFFWGGRGMANVKFGTAGTS